MLLRTVRFFFSVAAAFARLVQHLHKAALAAAAMAVAVSSSPARSPVGLIATRPLPLRRKASPVAPAAMSEKLLLVTTPSPMVAAAEVCDVIVNGEGVGVVVEGQQQPESKRKKTTTPWSARRRPSRLVIPVADDAGELAAGWGAAAASVAGKEADVEVEGEGFWVASRAGPRHAMEDAYSVITGKHCGGDSQLAFYGVFDGHGGRAAVDFVSKRLGENVVAAVLAADNEASSAADDGVSAAIRSAYLATDSELLSQHQDASGGACAATAVVKGSDLYIAHLGDCRAVLSHSGGVAAALTADHTCAAEDERARIERGGGYVCRSGSGVWRVQGSLAVSRSFGDGGLKRWVVAEPAVTKVALGAGCEFLVVASDGLWDKVSNQEAIDVVSRSRKASGAASVGRSCVVELVDMARQRGSRDDVTVMVVDLERFVR